MLPLSFLFGQELDEFGRLSDAVKERLTREQWIVWVAGICRCAKPLDRFGTIAAKCISAGDIERTVMIVFGIRLYCGHYVWQVILHGREVAFERRQYWPHGC